MGYHGAYAYCMQEDQRPSPAVSLRQHYLRDLKNENAGSYRVRVRLQERSFKLKLCFSHNLKPKYRVVAVDIITNSDDAHIGPQPYGYP